LRARRFSLPISLAHAYTNALCCTSRAFATILQLTHHPHDILSSGLSLASPGIRSTRSSEREREREERERALATSLTSFYCPTSAYFTVNAVHSYQDKGRVERRLTYQNDCKGEEG
jgi:hypothetical protein